ncbi:MAG: hypothetical protein C4318_04190 [Acidimicrobiia bacterium]
MAEATRRPQNKRGQTPTTPSRLLTPKEVAEYLSVTESQVYTLMREGDLLALKIGKRGVWRVDREELERYIESLKKEAIQRVRTASSRGKRQRKRSRKE